VIWQAYSKKFEAVKTDYINMTMKPPCTLQFAEIHAG